MSDRNDINDLYRYYDADGVLLYVGISVSAVARSAAHKGNAGWWGDVAAMVVEKFPTREDARIAEAAAIATENPLHNIQGKVRSRGWLESPEMKAHIAALVDDAPPLPPFVVAILQSRKARSEAA